MNTDFCCPRVHDGLQPAGRYVMFRAFEKQSPARLTEAESAAFSTFVLEEAPRFAGHWRSFVLSSFVALATTSSKTP